jgi:hypothetical protein
MRSSLVSCFAVAVALAVVVISVPVDGQSCLLDDTDKVDCGYPGIDSTSCLSKGCCWTPAGDNSATPWCFYGSAEVSSYAVNSIQETDYGFSGVLVKSSTPKGN